VIDHPTRLSLRDRRSVRNFDSAPISDRQLEAILEAARWAPSGRNSQPWTFVVVRDADLRSRLGVVLRRITWAWGAFASAPTMIVVSVDPALDPDHHVEDGAIAAQNLCLAAHSLGLGSAWAGVLGRRGGRRSVEGAIRRLLGLPAAHRVVAVIPIGGAARAGKSTRRPLAQMVHFDRFGSGPMPAGASAEAPATSVAGRG